MTKRLRRVAEFDWDAVRSAAEYNKPTQLAVMGVDRLDYANTGVTNYEHLTAEARQFLDRLDYELGVPINWVGTGFTTSDVVRVRVDAVEPKRAHV